jgi:hypothetical protein
MKMTTIKPGTKISEDPKSQMPSGHDLQAQREQQLLNCLRLSEKSSELANLTSFMDQIDGGLLTLSADDRRALGFKLTLSLGSLELSLSDDDAALLRIVDASLTQAFKNKQSALINEIYDLACKLPLDVVGPQVNV